MKKPLTKFLVALILLLILSLGIGYTVLYMLIKPSKLVPQITNMVQEKTGYVTSVKGNVSIALYPGIRVSLEELTIAKPDDNSPIAILKKVSFTSPWQLKNLAAQWHTSMRVEEINFKNLKFTNLTTTIIADKNALAFDQLHADFYAGAINAKLRFDKANTQESLWNIDGSNIDIATFLKDLQGTTQLSLVGRANIHFVGLAQRLSKKNLLEAMTGTLSFSVAPGAVKGIDLNYYIDKGVALLKHQNSTRDHTDHTQFDQLKGTLYIADSVAKSNDVLMKADTFVARIMGEMQLIDQTLDISLQVSPANQTRFMIPLLITGPIKKPSVALDTLLIQTILTKEEIEKIATKVGNELDKLPERTNKMLNQLLGK